VRRPPHITAGSRGANDGALEILGSSLFARVAVRAEEPPLVLPLRDGILLNNRFRSAMGAET
jgi:hypothetical protein